MVSKLMVAVMFVLLIFAGVSAQEGCNRTVSDAPPISGLKVGMSFEEVERALGTVAKIKPFKNGEGTIYLSFAEQTPPASLSGIGTLWLRLYKNRVYQLEVFYSGTKEGESISNFTNELSSRFQLPAAGWKIKNNFATLDCGELLIKADALLGRHVEVTDKAGKAEFDKKSAAEKAKKKQ